MDRECNLLYSHFRPFLVHVKNVNGKLKATLEEVKEEVYTENLPLELTDRIYHSYQQK